jgi:hypothetical protein
VVYDYDVVVVMKIIDVVVLMMIIDVVAVMKIIGVVVLMMIIDVVAVMKIIDVIELYCIVTFCSINHQEDYLFQIIGYLKKNEVEVDFHGLCNIVHY